jgi:hypothetical protein
MELFGKKGKSLIIGIAITKIYCDKINDNEEMHLCARSFVFVGEVEKVAE